MGGTWWIFFAGKGGRAETNSSPLKLGGGFKYFLTSIFFKWVENTNKENKPSEKKPCHLATIAFK